MDARAHRQSCALTVSLLVLAPILGACSCRDYSAGARAFIAVEPTSLDFGTVPEGQGATADLVLRNEGRAVLQIFSVQVAGDPRDAFGLVGGAGAELLPGEQRKLQVRYVAPLGDGVDTGFLVIESTAENAPSLQVGLLARSAASCVPEADSVFCARAGKNCGPWTMDDNCGVQRTVQQCGVCVAPQSCGAVAPGVCACVPETDAAFCMRLGKNCGTVSGIDNCGSSRIVASCGGCSGTDVCGAVTPNVCGCLTEGDAAFCARLGKNCGAVSAADNCGAPRSVPSCGTCTAPLWCGALTANVCACVPESDAAFCTRAGNKNCGTVSGVDNCGDARSAGCGTCGTGEACGLQVPNVCACVPESDLAFCGRLGKDCGSVTAPDNCGAARTVASCGTCTGPKWCAAAVPNVCGCIAESDATFCARLGTSCGATSGTDNCGNSRSVTCGTCPSPDGGTGFCAGGTCDFTCGPGFTRCQDQCCGVAVDISTGFGVSCAVGASGQGFCWGRPPSGDGANAGNNLKPVPVSGFVGGAQVESGAAYSCGVRARTSYCWGFNSSGQLGDGSATTRLVPSAALGLSGVVSRVSAGQNHTCAALLDGGVACWGSNVSGQLGDGTTTRSPSPVLVAGIDAGAVAVACGAQFTCALVSPPGAVWCWGSNLDGALGDGTGLSRLLAAPVPGLTSGVVDLSAGAAHVCAASLSDGARCWGGNGAGQLGDGTTASRLVPTAVVGLDAGVGRVAAGTDHSCLLTTGGAAYCWGANGYGQLGNGTSTPRLTPSIVLSTF